MYHSLAFFDPSVIKASTNDLFNDAEINTWTDWHLIPTTRPFVSPPPAKANFVELPGVSGALDFSEMLAGKPVYGNRTGSWEFAVANNYEPWDVIYSRIMQYLHGKRKVVMLEDEQSYYYSGRFVVNSWKSDPNYSLVTIEYVIDPYKISVQDATEAWLWDPFDFVTGDIQARTRKEIL